MVTRNAIVFVGLALLCAGAPAPAQTEKAQTEQPEIRIARLIQQLGSRSYQEREVATAELETLGPTSKKQLESAAQSSEAEVRFRAARLLGRLKVAELWQPRLVSVHAQDEPAAKVLARLAEQSGNRLFTGDHFGPFRDTPVTLELENVPFFRALDEICRRSSNQVRPNYDQRNPGLVLAQGDMGKCPLAYGGPVRAKITTARRVFIEELDYEPGGNETTHTFQLNLSLMWEDRFRLVAYQSQVEAVEAITDTGAALGAVPSTPSEWKTVSPGNRQVTMGLRLQPPPTAAKTLKTLRLRWGLLAVGDMSAVEVTNFQQSTPHVQDDLELTVASFQELPENRYEITLLVNRELVVPEPQDVLFQENSFDLLDQQGRTLRKQINHWRWTDSGLRISATFSPDTVERTANDPSRKPARLQFAYPRIRAQQDLEILFSDVTLPSAKPE